MNIKQLAKCFLQGKPGRCHNARVEVYRLGVAYVLHGHTIAFYSPLSLALFGSDKIVYHWCGWYTTTTANHINHIIDADGRGKRVSYARHRDAYINNFSFNNDSTLVTNEHI